MKTETSASTATLPADPRRGRRVAALVLLVVAGFALLSPHLPWSWRGGILLPLGVAFLVWAALVRSPGLLVPGGVLCGLGAGLGLISVLGPSATLFGLAGGFLLIAALHRLLLGRAGVSWPLWPAAGLAFAGVMVLTAPYQRELWREQRDLWRVAAEYWPYAVIAVALWLFFAPARKQG